MEQSCTILLEFLDRGPNWVFKVIPNNLNTVWLNRLFVVGLAIGGEVFGEPYGGKLVLLNHKAVTYKVAKNQPVNTSFLQDLRQESKVNPIVLDPFTYYDVMPPSCEATLEEIEETKSLQHRESLRIKSEITAKNTADCIKRIALF